MNKCYVYANSGSLNKSELYTELSSVFEVTKFDDVLHVQVDGNEVFFFPYASVVTWGLSADKERQMVTILKSVLDDTDGDEDEDEYTFSYDKKTHIEHDHFSLTDGNVLTKLAFSYGVAQSTKLAAFELTIQKTVFDTRRLPSRLAKDGSIRLSRRETRKLMGRIFSNLSMINLHLDFLGAPDFFWEHPDLEDIHNMVVDYLGQLKRFNVLNNKLSVLQEFIDVLATELNNQHSSKLEWTIIILIMVEIIVTLGKEFFELF